MVSQVQVYRTKKISEAINPQRPLKMQIVFLSIGRNVDIRFMPEGIWNKNINKHLLD